VTDLKARIATIQARADAATHGPWHFAPDLTPWREMNGFWRVEIGGDTQSRAGRHIATVRSGKENAVLLASARTDVPELCALLTRAVELLERASTAVWDSGANRVLFGDEVAAFLRGEK